MALKYERWIAYRLASSAVFPEFGEFDRRLALLGSTFGISDTPNIKEP